MLVRRVGLGVCVGLASVACQTIFGAEEEPPAASATSSSSSTGGADTAASSASGQGGAGLGGGAGGSAGDGGTAGGGGSLGAGQGGSGGAPSPCPPNMIFVQGAGWSFCVDEFEVTRAAYQDWLDGNPDPAGQIPKCQWNGSFVPYDAGNSCDPTDYDPVNNAAYPVVCVDWCDARAYCAGVDKRLCGQMGDGSPYPYGMQGDAAASEWYVACSAGGTKKFPYGDVYDKDICYGDEHDNTVGNGAADKPALPGSKAQCLGGYPGIFDMSGNVWEWDNSCEPDPNLPGDENDLCTDRGGSFWDLEEWLECGHAPPGNHTRSAYNQNIGIRCCADVLPVTP